MTPITLIATDLDGTFFGAKSEVIPENIEAFRAAREAGVALAICSGRCPIDIRNVHRQLNMKTWIIGFNGAIVRDPETDEDIFCRPIRRAALEEVIRFLDELDVEYSVCGTGLRYTLSRGAHREAAERTRVHMAAHDVEIRPFDDWHEIPDCIMDHCMKVISSSSDPALAARLQRESAAADLPVTITSSWWNNIEAVEKGVDKGVGIEMLCRHLGLSPADTMVLGDQKNDLPMFRVAGWPVAMGNGDEAVKAAARIITGTNVEAGVAQAVRRYVLGQEG